MLPRAWILPLVVVAAGSVAIAASSGPTVERTSWKGRAGGTIHVENLLGDVRARRADQDLEVEVFATLQQFPGAQLRVEAREVPDGVEVEVLLDGALGPDAPARADLVLFVPDGAKLDVETSAGLVECKKLRGDVAASTGAGEVRVTGAFGNLDVRTVRGSILATLDPWTAGRTRSLGSMTGDIVAYLPEGIDADVSAATSGEISTDYSIEISHVLDAEPTKRARARIGLEARKDSPLSIQTLQGQVKILRIQKVFSTTAPSEARKGEP